MRFKEYVKIRPEKFGSVIFDTLREKIFVSNPTGARILSLIEDGKSQEEIEEALGKEYNAPFIEIKTSLESFLADLRESNLLLE